MYEWPTAQVEACNIGILEMVTEQVAADLQNSVQTAVYGQDERHYLLSLGDNQAVSDHVLNSARASTTEMRFLAAQRAKRVDDGVRMCSSKQLHREFNTPADRLAAGDITGAVLVRLDVPAESASLDKLIEWSAEINAHGTLHRPAVPDAGGPRHIATPAMDARIRPVRRRRDGNVLSLLFIPVRHLGINNSGQDPRRRVHAVDAGCVLR